MNARSGSGLLVLAAHNAKHAAVRSDSVGFPCKTLIIFERDPPACTNGTSAEILASVFRYRNVPLCSRLCA